MTLMSSLMVSPERQRRLHRTMEAGSGFCARQLPLAYSKKSVQGSMARFMSVSSTPLGVEEAGMSSADTRVVAKSKGSKNRIRMRTSKENELLKLERLKSLPCREECDKGGARDSCIQREKTIHRNFVFYLSKSLTRERT